MGEARQPAERVYRCFGVSSWRSAPDTAYRAADRAGGTLRPLPASAATFLAALVVSVAGCSVSGGASAGRMLDTDEAEQRIRQFVESTYDARAQDAACPERPLEKGDVFQCTARFEEQSLRMTVTQDDDKGNVTINPAQAVIVTQAAEDDIARVLREQLGTTAAVDCGSQRLLVKDPGATFDCQAADPKGATRRVIVTVKDTEGNVDYKLG